jgi:hypothetical protein
MMEPHVKGAPAIGRRSFTLGAIAGAGVATSACGGGADTVARAAAAQRRPLDLSAADPLPELVRFATLAANGHNTQPWEFKRSGKGVVISGDASRRTPVVDPDDHHLYASLGCAAENLMLAAGAYGLGAAYKFDVRSKSIGIDLTPTGARADSLVAAIPRRQCTRSVYDGRAVPAAERAMLQEAAKLPGVDVAVISERPAIDAIRDAVIANNRLQMEDEKFVAELMAWIRFDGASALAASDGLYGAASGNPVIPAWVGRIVFPWVFTVEGESKKYREQMDSSAGVAVFAGAADDPAHWALAGRAYQRFALRASALGIKHAFINQPIEVASARAAFADAVGFAGRRVDLVVRFGYAQDFPFSLRREVGAVLRG